MSLKQALLTLGFEGEGRENTEGTQWTESEKEHLAEVMARYGVRRIDVDKPHEHLSVLNYKKQESAQRKALAFREDWKQTLAVDKTGSEYIFFIIAGTVGTRVWVGNKNENSITEIEECMKTDGLYQNVKQK